MSQNIYDDPDFFAEYATLDRSVKGLDGAGLRIDWAPCRTVSGQGDPGRRGRYSVKLPPLLAITSLYQWKLFFLLRASVPFPRSSRST